MPTETILYTWKIPKPKDQVEADGLISAAYQTAKLIKPDTREILIRSVIHSTTLEGGKYVVCEPHITISMKDEDQQKHGTHETAHGLTGSLGSFDVLRTKSGGTGEDNFRPETRKRNPRGSSSNPEIWPRGLPSEERTYTL